MEPDPNQIRRLAGLCGAGTDAVARASRDLCTASANITWRGPAADRFHEQLISEHAVIVRLTQDLLSLGSSLSAHANRVEERHRVLRGLEIRIRGWAAAHPLTSPLPGANASILGAFPPPLDPRWETLAVLLRRAGAVF